MKKTFRVSIITILLISLIYVTNITQTPNTIIIFQGEKINIKTILGINLKQKESYVAMQTSSSINQKIEDAAQNVRESRFAA